MDVSRVTRTFAAPVLAATVIAVVFAFARPSGANAPPAATSHFSVFNDESSRADPATVEELRARTRDLDVDLTEARVSGRSLGSHQLRLAMFPGRSDRNLCYSTISEDPSGSEALYCFTPRGPDAAPPNASAHLNVLKLYSAVGGRRVDVFGVVFDDVTSLRIQVRGEWETVSFADNGFYAEIPDASLDDVGIVEATLTDGSVQRWDTRTGGLAG